MRRNFDASTGAYSWSWYPSMQRVISIVVSGLVSVGCGPEGIEEDVGEAALCRSPAPAAVDPLGDPAVCANYEAEEPGAAISIAFVNRLDEDILLQGFCRGYFRLLGAPGGRLAVGPVTCDVEPSPCAWGLGCEAPGCVWCPEAPAIRISPGMRFETTWEPLVMVEAELPVVCADKPELAGACMATRRPSPGAYLLQGRFLRASACESECDCEPGVDGWCELPGFSGGPVEALRDVPAVYDGVCGTIEFVIE